MYRPLAQANRSSSQRDATGNVLLHPFGQARRRDINGLLKKRAVQRVRLVEKRENLQLAVRENAFQRDLEAGDEVLNQKRGFLLRIALGEQQPFQAIDGSDALGFVIGAD